MTVSSMTGFARTEGEDDLIRWVWEARSVNGKSLDARIRVPSGWEQFDPVIRKAVQERFKRGNLTINLEVKPILGKSMVRINDALLDDLIQRCEAFGERPRLDMLFTVRGVVEASEQDPGDLASDPDRLSAVQGSLDDVLVRLSDARAEEGARIDTVLRDHLGEIETLVEDAERSEEATPQAIRDRLWAQISDLLPQDGAIPSERLAQEAAILATKADVREEIDRLKAHVDAARDLLRDGVGIGRRFDFLCQEFNREANTLASKSSSLDLTRIGLNLKAVIDRLREQVQNLE
ncbi:YicC/YloC family endoribonuclease [Hwanghaeella sp. 1Z406]|uniref:YicC/YloC family endoribonuclease n=1 Tax=Hwanghaeella sp. 1Z406 TaxID=3402811 RepID=UPI0026CCB440